MEAVPSAESIEKRKRRLLFALLLITACLLPSGVSRAQSGGLSDEAQACLACHARSGSVLTFLNNERIDVVVEPDAYMSSVHHALSCSECHPDFSGGQHPRRSFRSKLQYQIKAALVCKRCHSDEQIKTRGVHVALLRDTQKGLPMTCTNCHGSHAIRRVTGGALTFASEEEYCMKCHKQSVRIRFRNGETHSARVRMSSLQRSVHGKLSCSDCHYGFSSEEHPKRNFESVRNYTLSLSENCRRCHFDKYTKMLECIHYTMLSGGNTKAPVCVDCHGAHEISHIAKERPLIAKRCRQCHPGIYDIYAKSVHGNALFEEHNKDVPVCTDCHTAHTIEDPRSINYRERIPEMCGNCHADRTIVGKYGLSPAVLDSYLSDFHGVTLKFYSMRKGTTNKPVRSIVVCTDCHGTHNITSTVGPNATVIKANLVNRCRECHPNASENFPDAWLPHYEPSLRRTPLVFLVKLAYKIFTPLLVVGLLLQILLHIWRYVVSR
jgi:predicted CXXCH cytochrome family protein